MTDQDWLGRLNSATKYPSIMTYHDLDPRNGQLLEGTALGFGDATRVVLTEKIDGTNGRVVVMPDGDWFIGSREELLYAKGDRIENPNLGIVPVLLPVARLLLPAAGPIVGVFFFEVYGKGVGPAAGHYSSKGVDGVTGCRLFDIAAFPQDKLALTREAISSWRQHVGQDFAGEQRLHDAAEIMHLDLVPRLGTVNGSDLPRDLAGMRRFLDEYLPTSLAVLDDVAGGRPEGIVLRTEDRSLIAKARFADYDRALNPQGGGKKRQP